jgi:AmmeMemoRadiSam system protein B
VSVRRPVAAGRFYPRDPEALAATVDALLGVTQPDSSLRGVVAPHAGYAYSGPVAAAAFRLAPRPERVVVLGPSHFVPLDWCAVSTAPAWTTPLGDVPVDDELRNAAIAAGCHADDEPHASDHAVEVELPFLQRICGPALSVLPMAVGRADPADVARALAALDAFVVVSTDLSHFLDHAAAQERDRRTAAAVLALDTSALGDGDACGAHALRGTVEHARRAGLRLDLLDLRTSGDATGDRDRVVGYGAFAVRA